MTVRRTQKAINTINSFVPYSGGKKSDPRVKESLKQSLNFKPDGRLVWWWSRELHSFNYEGSSGGSVSFPPHSVSLLDCQFRPVIWVGQQGRSRLSSSSSSSSFSSSSCYKAAAPRSWWRSCWGKVPAFHEVVLSTNRRHLTNGHEQISVQLLSDRHLHNIKITAAVLSHAYPLW